MITEYLLNGYTSIMQFVNLLFPVELIAAQLLFLHGFDRKPWFAGRMTLVAVLVGLYCLFVPQLLTSPWMALLYFTVLFALSVPAMGFCFQIGLKELLFCCSAGFCVQNMAVNLNALLYLDGFGSNMYAVTRYVLLLVVYYLAFRIYQKRFRGAVYVKLSLKQAVAFAGLTIFAANFMNCFSVPVFTDWMSFLVSRLAIVFLDFFIMYIQFVLFANNAMAEELQQVREILNKDKKIFEQSQSNIQVLNMYLHDLKYWLLSRNSDPSFAVDLMRLIDDYDIAVRTGNEALDVVLYETSTKCHAHGIALSTVADGHALDFMKANEVYSLMGNLLDNAVEAVLRIEGNANRSISVAVSAANGKVHVRVENYFDGKIVFRDSYPVTSKTDGGIHGYGLKSVGYIVEKYGGELCIQIDDNIYTIDITIPLK